MELGKKGATWLANVMGDQDRGKTVAAWKETMAFDSRKRLASITAPTLVVAGAKDEAVPLHHARMLHDEIPDSRGRRGRC